MRRTGSRVLSIILAVILFLSCVTEGYIPAQAATENGYDRGYDGGFAGDGVIYCEGLDLSSWQDGAVNFTAIKAMGYDYVILRLGTSKMTAKDTCFDEFYAGAKAVGLDVGAYFYSYATTEAAVQEDIAKCKEWLAGTKLEYPFYFDYEDSSQADLPTDTALSIINTFIDAFVEEGYLMGLYSMKSWMTQSWITSSSLPTTYEGWVAHYAGDGTYDAGYEKYGDTYSTQYGMYQYTDKHYFTYNGVTYGPYDADICYKDYPAIVKEYGFNGYEPSGVTAAKESLQATVDLAVNISHHDYAEATINQIRTAYKTALSLLSSDTATKAELDAANTTLTELLANTGSNTIAQNNVGVYISGRNQKVTSGACVLYSPTWNDGLITVSNANIAYTVNVVFKWDESLGFNVVKSISYGTGTSTPDIQLEADEFLLAAHDWETGVTSGAIEGSAANYKLLASLKVGDRVKLSGATALNAGTDVELAAYAKFMPAGSVTVHGRNTAISAGKTVLFTPAFNSGLLTAANANIHLTLNVRAKWSVNENAWVIVEKFSGDGATGESSNIELAADEILFAAHYNVDDITSIKNWGYLNDAEIGQKITFSGVSPDASKTAISCAANISFSDAEYVEPEVTPENIASSATVTVTNPGETDLTADLTDGIADTDLDGAWFGLMSDSSSASCNTTDGVGTITFDLGKRYQISTIMAHFYIGNGSDTIGGALVGAPESVSVSVSVDGVNYYKAGELSMDDCAVGTCWAGLTDAEAVARYVKLEIACKEPWTLLNEVKILGTEKTAGGENIALDKDYAAPGYADSPYTADLTDGKASTVFQADVNNSSWFGFLNTGDENTGNVNPTSNNGIITIDLGGMAELTGVNLNVFAGSNTVGATDFNHINVYYSVDGVSYQYIGTIAPTAGMTAPYWASLDFSSAPKYGRFVKFAVNASADELILMNEIRVMGTMITGNPPVEPGTMSTVVLVGSFNNWNPTPNMLVVDESTVSVDLKLEKGDYEFKVLFENLWYGNETTITNGTAGKLTLYTDSSNCKLTANAAGTYRFTFNHVTKELSVIYIPDTLYLRGSFNEWGTDLIMTDNGDGTYSVTTNLAGGTYEFKIANEDYSAEWPASNYVLEVARTSDVTVTLNVYTGEITVTQVISEYTVTFVDYDGTILSTQTVATGAAATAPTVPAREGYAFTGWNKQFDSVTEDLTVTAQYASTIGKLKIDINGSGGFTISVNDGAARPQGNSYYNTKMEIGSKITVTANEVSGNAFLGWVNVATNQVVSTELTYTFYTSGNDHYTAMYTFEIESVNLVIFMNDKTSQILDMQYYAAGDEIIVPAEPSNPSYDFAGWQYSVEEIQAKLEAGEDVTVNATWTKKQVYVNVTVTGGTVTVHSGMNDSGQYLASYALTITADEAPEGQKFAYWTDGNGVIKSYNSTYKFYPAVDTAMTAVFVDEAAEIDYQVLVNVDTADTTSVDGKIIFYFSWYVPEEQEGLTYVHAGILGVNKLYYDEDTFYAGTSDTNVYDRGPATGNAYNTAENTFSWTKGSISEGDTWVVRAYVQYYDADGNLITVYSDLVEATK